MVNLHPKWGGQSCRTKTLTFGIYCYVQVNSVRIELNFQILSLCQSMAWWHGKCPVPPHIEIMTRTHLHFYNSMHQFCIKLYNPQTFILVLCRDINVVYFQHERNNQLNVVLIKLDSPKGNSISPCLILCTNIFYLCYNFAT